MKDQQLSYESAFQELKTIAEALDQHQLPVDELSKMVERAAELTSFCKEELRKVDIKLENIKDKQS